MRIAIDARIIATGTGRYIERLLNYLENLDDDNEYLILVRNKDLDYYKPRNPRFKIVEADFADYSLGEQWGLAKLLYSLKVDLVHFCMPQQPLLYVKKAVTTVHDLNLLRIKSNDDMGPAELFVKKIIFAILLLIVTYRSKKIIAISDYTKQDLLRFSGVSSKKVVRIYEGADVNNYAPTPIAELKNKDFISYVGRAEPYKNNRNLIVAHQQLLKDHPDLHLAIVGSIDFFRKADQEWVRLRRYKNVHFLGFISNNQLAWLYKNTKAYVIPSFMEGFNLPGLEAVAGGAPLVSSDRTCLPEVYDNAAHYFDPADPNDMARAIGDVITDDKLRKELAKNGERVRKRYSWEKMARETLDVYNEV